MAKSNIYNLLFEFTKKDMEGRGRFEEGKVVRTETRTSKVVTTGGTTRYTTEGASRITTENTARKSREERLARASSGNAFSGLTAPARSTWEKSNITEERKSKQEWSRDVEMQPEDEEDMAIANAFVLKAQKYKAAQLASPTNMRGNTSKTSTVTTTKIGRRTVQGATTTTKPVWKDGRKEIVTTQIKGTGKVKPATYADSKKTASKKSSDKEGEYTFNSGKRVKFETTRESKIMRTGGLTGTKEVNYQYTGEIEDSSQGISQSKLQGIDEGRSQATIEGRTQYEAINDAKMKLSSLQEARSLKAEERAESKDTTYKFPEPSLENRDEARYEFSGGNNSQSRLGITGGRSIESRYQMTRKSMGSPRFGDTDEERKETRYEQASEEDTEAMYGSKGEETIHTRYELTGQNNSQSKYEMSGGRYSRTNYGITSQDSAEARYGSSTDNYKARYGLPQEDDSEMKYERTEGTRISTTKKIEKSRIISGRNSDTKEVTYKTYQAFSGGNSAREESRYQADEGPGGYTTKTIESRVTSSEKSPGEREYIYKYTGDKDLVEGTSSRYEYIDGKRVLVSETIEKRMGNLESSGNKGTAFEYSGARYKTIGGKRLLTTEKSDESELKSGGISQRQENTHAYSGGLGGDQKSRYSIYSIKRSLGGDSIGSNLMKSGEVSSSKDYSYKHSREQEEGEYEIINGKRVKVSESQEMRYSRSGDEGRVSYEFTKSKPATSKSSISIGESTQKIVLNI